MWNPFTAKGGCSIWAALSNPQVWLAAASQIFFSLSVGFGIIMTYSTYLRRNEDVALNGLTAASTNEFCEVCLGGLITIPAAFIFLGLGAVQGAGTFDLGFYTTPAVFAHMPAGQFFGFVWFFMLLLAAITSSLSMLQPAIAFFEEGFGLKRRGSVALLGLLTANGTLVVVYFSEGLTGLDTMDFWIGNLCIFIMATVLVLLFAWVIGAERGFRLAREGSELRIPGFFTYVIKYISPVYLLVIFVLWVYHNAGDYVRSIVTNNAATFTMVFIILVMIFFGVLVRLANARWTAQGRDVREINE
jgi:SNF family Na+-dependent transporter